MKIRPCDCNDMFTAKKLNEQGIAINDHSIVVEPSVVILRIDHTTIRINQKTFHIFAEWYLKEQEIK